MKLRGIFPIVATPFHANGQIDERALRRVVDFCLDCGVHGLVWPAVASEFYALSDDERKHYSRVVIEQAAGRVPVVIGVSGGSLPVAAHFAADAIQAGADALMALPPYIVKDDLLGVCRYYEAIARAAEGRPVLLQNAAPPLGQGLSPAAVASLARDVSGLTYIKEETIPSGHAISRILAEAGAHLEGVFGGAGGRNLIDEYVRGACGAMPGCELSDVFVTLWAHLEAEQMDEARSLFERMLPMLLMQGTYRMAFTKETLKRRGVLSGTAVRLESGLTLDASDHVELDAMLTRLQPDLRVAVERTAYGRRD